MGKNKTVYPLKIKYETQLEKDFIYIPKILVVFFVVLIVITISTIVYKSDQNPHFVPTDQNHIEVVKRG